MRLVSEIYDKRIETKNWLAELTIKEYLQFATKITENNEFQRRRVSSSKTVYSLLQKDLRIGCVIPPIVLALTINPPDNNLSDENFKNFLKNHIDDLIILDGLQRTFTIIDLIKELEKESNQPGLLEVLKKKLRVEFYIGINRIGILYRMLTLNTGQTPMSLRQQIEILYLDYQPKENTGIKLIRETDTTRAINNDQYNFRDMIEGFNSYLDRNEIPMSRSDILENIESLEKLSRENQRKDLFAEFLQAFHIVYNQIISKCDDYEISESFQNELGDNQKSFGKNAQQIFKRPQSMAGFGAAIGKLIDYNLIHSFTDIQISIGKLDISHPSNFLDEINRNMNWIKDNSKKIGNAQRSYFQYFFRELLNPENQNYLKGNETAKTAFQKFINQNF